MAIIGAGSLGQRNATAKTQNLEKIEMNSSENLAEQWYIIKRPQGHCEILPQSVLADHLPSTHSPESATWGPFMSRNDAIARRVGLIRSGHCQPISPQSSLS